MRLIALMAAVVLIAAVAGCAGAGPTPTRVRSSAPSAVGVQATVDVAVAATRTAAPSSIVIPTVSVTRQVELTREAAGLPSAIPEPTATSVPTPPPYTAPVGAIEQGASELWSCLESNEFLQSAWLEMMEAEGLSSRSAEYLLGTVIEDEDAFVEMALELVEEDPAFGSFLALFVTIDDFGCGAIGEPLGVLSADEEEEVRMSLGMLHDCVMAEPEMAAEWRELYVSEGAPEGYFDDREWFVESIVASIQLGEAEAFSFEELDSLLQGACP